MNLNLFENKKTENNFINKFIEELKNALTKCKQNNELDEYNTYEKKKIFLDNKSRKGNDLAWVIDENSVCISENGDGGPTSIEKIDLPQNAKTGEVYQKINGKYMYNAEITNELMQIKK